MRLTLAAALPLLARYAVQGACTTDPRVVEKINEARERLMTKPENWKGKIQRFLFCADRACVTLPREVETVEAASICQQVMRMRSKWYDLLEGGPGPGRQCGGDAVIDRGDGYVTFADLDIPRTVKVYADVPESAGARLLLQGFDENGNRVRTWDATTNSWVDGEYVGINNETPQVSTTVFSSLDGIQKPETNGFVRVYAFTVGVPAQPATDVTTVVNWDGTTSQIGTIQWPGDLLAASWTGPLQDLDFVLQLFYEPGGDLNSNLFTIDGVPQNGFTQASWSWVANSAPVTTEYTGGVIPGTAVALNTPPFIPTINGVTWGAMVSRTFYIFFRGDGEGDGGGTFYVFDAALNEISVSVEMIIPGPSWTFVLNVIFAGIPFGQFTLTGDADVSQLFTLNENYGFKVEQTDIGTLSITTLTDGIVPTPPDWNASFQFSEFLAPDLFNGGFYGLRVTRNYTDAVPAIPDYLSLMSILHPDETNPSYRRYEIPKLRGTCGSLTQLSEGDQRQVIIMAKLRYLPVKRSTDFLIVENIGALKHMLLAINAEEKNDLNGALQHEARAVEILAQELRNHIGDAASSEQGMQVQTDAWAAGNIPCIL
jgi:hypothetical protein